MRYMVNEQWEAPNKKVAVQWARGLASAVYQAKLNLGVPKKQAREESKILVRPK